MEFQAHVRLEIEYDDQVGDRGMLDLDFRGGVVANNPAEAMRIVARNVEDKVAERLGK